MKLSLLSEYALLSLIHLVRQSNTATTSASIGVSQQIPPEMLHEILITLVNAKYLRLTKGNFRLAKPAEKIPVIDIIRLFDGALAPLEPVSEKGYQPAPMENEEKLTSLFGQLQEQIIDKLENTTLADLI
jgi:Rrf2 family transcriptional regulator, cysteine metabolism repressor